MEHTLRNNRLLNRLVEGMLDGLNAVGIPLVDYLQKIMRDVSVQNYRQMTGKAENLVEWGFATILPHSC